MKAPDSILALHDLDLLRSELKVPRLGQRLKRLGFGAPDPDAAERMRSRLLGTVDRRWLHHYERAYARYGRGVAAVRGRVCLGCFITLPTSASPSGEERLTTCESCGRILYWR